LQNKKGFAFMDRFQIVLGQTIRELI